MMNWEILAQTMPEEINGVPIDACNYYFRRKLPLY